MRCLFKALFVLKALHFVACYFLDLLGLRKADVVKKVDDFQDRDLTAISSRELVAVPRYREPMTANYPCVWYSALNKHRISRNQWIANSLSFGAERSGNYGVYYCKIHTC